jgi:adrenodoxin-NADP+ reductase
MMIRGYCTVAKPLKVCVVGSGPAGFYSVEAILKHVKNSRIDIVEKLPVPFGLVRYGKFS